MGPSGEVELSEADMDKLMAAKSRAAELNSDGKYQEAIEAFTAAIKMQPSPLLFARRAEGLLKIKEFKAAVRDCDAALKLNADSAKAYKVRGKAYAELCEWEKAAKDLSTGKFQVHTRSTEELES